NLYMAQSLPQVEIVSATAAPLAAGAADSATHELTVTVRNSGRLPTALEQAKRIKIVRPDRVVIQGARGSSIRQVGRAEEFWLGAGESRVVKVRVRAGSGDSDRKVTVRLESTRGGVSVQEVAW